MKTSDLEKLKNRWKRDVINMLVLGLNSGESIRTLIGQCSQAGNCHLEFETDLRGIDLSFQNLRGPWHHEQGLRSRKGVDLSGMDLTGADLSWAILPRASLKGCILQYASLKDAELIMADLSGADLSHADLTGAWLLDTKFTGAVVTPGQLKTRRNLGQMDFDYHAFEI